MTEWSNSPCLTTAQGEGMILTSWFHAGYGNNPVGATSMTERSNSPCLTTAQGEGVISTSWFHAGYSNNPVGATSLTEWSNSPCLTTAQGEFVISTNWFHADYSNTSVGATSMTEWSNSPCLTTAQGQGKISTSWFHADYSNTSVGVTSMTEGSNSQCLTTAHGEGEGDPLIYSRYIKRVPDIESLCKVWWNSNCLVYFKWSFNLRSQIYKLSATFVPPIWTAWLVSGDSPVLFWIFKGYLRMTAYAKFHGFLTVGYFLNGPYLLNVTVTFSNTLLCL